MQNGDNATLSLQNDSENKFNHICEQLKFWTVSLLLTMAQKGKWVILGWYSTLPPCQKWPPPGAFSGEHGCGQQEGEQLILLLKCYQQKDNSLHGLKPIFMTLYDVPYPTTWILLKKQYHKTRTGCCSLEMVKYFACFHHAKFKKGESFTGLTLTKSIWHSELCTIHKAVLFHSYIFFPQILNTNHNSLYCNGLL